MDTLRTFRIFSANCSIVYSSGLPMLTGSEKFPFISATRPSTRSETYWNDRVCRRTGHSPLAKGCIVSKHPTHGGSFTYLLAFAIDRDRAVLEGLDDKVGDNTAVTQVHPVAKRVEDPGNTHLQSISGRAVRWRSVPLKRTRESNRYKRQEYWHQHDTEDCRPRTHLDTGLAVVGHHHRLCNPFPFVVTSPRANRVDIPAVVLGLRMHLWIAINL